MIFLDNSLNTYIVRCTTQKNTIRKTLHQFDGPDELLDDGKGIIVCEPIVDPEPQEVQLAGGPVREIRADNNVLAVDVLRDDL